MRLVDDDAFVNGGETNILENGVTIDRRLSMRDDDDRGNADHQG